MLKAVPVLLEDILSEDSLLQKYLPSAIERADLSPDRPSVALTVDGDPRYFLQTKGLAVVVGQAPAPEDPDYERFLSLPRVDLVVDGPGGGPSGAAHLLGAETAGPRAPRSLSQIFSDIREKPRALADRPIPEGEPWRPKPASAATRNRAMEVAEVEATLARYRKLVSPLDGPYLVALLRSALAYGDEASAWRAISIIAPGATFRVVDDQGWTSVEAMEGWRVTTIQLGGGVVPPAHALLVGAISLRRQRLGAQTINP